MTHIDKISSQVAKVRAKIAELEAVKEEYDNAANDLTQAYSTENLSLVSDIRDYYLNLAEKKNRMEGVIKRMSRKAIELYYDRKCEWLNFEYAFQYISVFNKTFANWN